MWPTGKYTYIDKAHRIILSSFRLLCNVLSNASKHKCNLSLQWKTLVDVSEGVFQIAVPFNDLLLCFMLCLCENEFNSFCVYSSNNGNQTNGTVTKTLPVQFAVDVAVSL